MPMIGELLSQYQKFEISLADKLSLTSTDIVSEAPFYDDGFIKVVIDELKQKMNAIVKDIEVAIKFENSNDIRTKEKINRLMKEKNTVKKKIVFLASNSLNGIEMCTNLMDREDDFSLCIQGLEYYSMGEENAAFEKFHEYYKKYGVVNHHYLINKTYGILLMDRMQDKMAIKLLKYALSFMPDDIDIYKKLYILYERNNRKENAYKIEQMIQLLAIPKIRRIHYDR